METVLLDFIAVVAVLIPTVLLIIYVPINRCLKLTMKKLLVKSIEVKKIRFTHQSPRLLKIWVQKNPSGKWSLLTRYFFCYQQGKKQISGQAIVSNKTLVDIKFYPPEYQDPYGKFPILSANDERIQKHNVVHFNDF